MDTSAKVSANPLYEQYIATAGFSTVDATATINVSAANFSRVFSFTTNDNTVQDVSYSVDICYGVSGTSVFNNIPFSKATVLSGDVNPAITNPAFRTVASDYIRYIAKSITGGYSLTDIFTNQADLVASVTTIDPVVQSNFNSLIPTTATYKTFSSGDAYAMSTKQLLDGILSVSGSTRSDQLIQDLGQQSAAHATSGGFNDRFPYYITLFPGDVIAVRLTYTPANGTGQPATNPNGKRLGPNPIGNRTYKIFLQMV
jgi:hypothetical protein